MVGGRGTRKTGGVGMVEVEGVEEDGVGEAKVWVQVEDEGFDMVWCWWCVDGGG